MSFHAETIRRSSAISQLGYRSLMAALASAGRTRSSQARMAKPDTAASIAPPDATEQFSVADLLRSYPDLDVSFDAERGIYWQWMQPQRRPSYTMELLTAMRNSLDQVCSLSTRFTGTVRYVITGSRVPGVFNLGGDLPHFAALIEAGDRETLRRYAHACIDVQFARATNMSQPYVSISLVQGDALGGGFECALADDLIIAEKGAKFGLPEVLFGLFPGMGAFSFLSRRLGDAMAEKMILSGRIYTAEELHEMGLVAALAEPGEGEMAVLDFIQRDRRNFRARTALSRIRQRVEPITREELIDVTDTWVDTALTLGPAELRKMRRLASAQDRRWQQIKAGMPNAADAGLPALATG